jgi:hypothetical protein
LLKVLVRKLTRSSALVTLHCSQIAIENRPSTESGFHNQVRNFAEGALREIVISCQQFNAGLSQPPERFSPFSLHWLYIATLVYFLQSREDGGGESIEACGILKETLKILNERWSLAGMVGFLHE